MLARVLVVERLVLVRVWVCRDCIQKISGSGDFLCENIFRGTLNKKCSRKAFRPF